MQHFKLRYTPFPAEIRGVILGLTTRKGKCLTIAIDSTLPEIQQAATLRHELAHIALDHFADSRPVKQIEEEADSYAARMTETEFNNLMAWEV